jgi:peroxiredoxin family protein
MDVFGYEKEDFIDGVEFAGAATALEIGADADMSLYI